MSQNGGFNNEAWLSPCGHVVHPLPPVLNGSMMQGVGIHLPRPEDLMPIRWRMRRIVACAWEVTSFHHLTISFQHRTVIASFHEAGVVASDADAPPLQGRPGREGRSHQVVRCKTWSKTLIY